MTPPCTFPVDGTRCGTDALYGFTVEGWPPGRRAAVCPGHAQATRDVHPVSRMWSLTGWDYPGRVAARSPTRR